MTITLVNLNTINGIPAKVMVYKSIIDDVIKSWIITQTIDYKNRIIHYFINAAYDFHMNDRTRNTIKEILYNRFATTQNFTIKKYTFSYISNTLKNFWENIEVPQNLQCHKIYIDNNLLAFTIKLWAIKYINKLIIFWDTLEYTKNISNIMKITKEILQKNVNDPNIYSIFQYRYNFERNISE